MVAVNYRLRYWDATRWGFVLLEGRVWIRASLAALASAATSVRVFIVLGGGGGLLERQISNEAGTIDGNLRSPRALCRWPDVRGL